MSKYDQEAPMCHLRQIFHYAANSEQTLGECSQAEVNEIWLV